MESQTFKSDNWHRTYQLILILGFILSIGSISSFIVMNEVLGATPSIVSAYWQRLFVSKITYSLILPGICLILSATVLLIKNYGFAGNTWLFIVLILVVLIVLNSINITLLAEKVTSIAVHQKEVMTNIPEYNKLKGREDIYGGINLFMLLISLIISIYKWK